MLDKDIFKAGVIKLTHAFPTWNIQLDNSDCMKLWYKKFKDMEKWSFEVMIESFIDRSKFNPTVAGLKEFGKEVDQYANYGNEQY